LTRVAVMALRGSGKKRKKKIFKMVSDFKFQNGARIKSCNGEFQYLHFATYTYHSGGQLGWICGT